MALWVCVWATVSNLYVWEKEFNDQTSDSLSLQNKPKHYIFNIRPSIYPSTCPSINTKASQYTTPTPHHLQFSFFPLRLSASPGALFDGDMKHLLG